VNLKAVFSSDFLLASRPAPQCFALRSHGDLSGVSVAVHVQGSHGDLLLHPTNIGAAKEQKKPNSLVLL